RDQPHGHPSTALAPPLGDTVRFVVDRCSRGWGTVDGLVTLTGREFLSALLALLLLSARISVGSAATTDPHGNALQGSAAPTADSRSAAPAPGSPAGEAGLGPTTAVPWNPPKPASTGDTWEKVVRFPGLLVSIPLIGLDYLFEHSLIAAEQTSMV